MGFIKPETRKSWPAAAALGSGRRRPSELSSWAGRKARLDLQGEWARWKLQEKQGHAREGDRPCPGAVSPHGSAREGSPDKQTRDITGEGWKAGERSVLTRQHARERWIAANNGMRTFQRKISLALVCEGLRCRPVGCTPHTGVEATEPERQKENRRDSKNKTSTTSRPVGGQRTARALPLGPDCLGLRRYWC